MAGGRSSITLLSGVSRLHSFVNYYVLLLKCTLSAFLLLDFSLKSLGVNKNGTHGKSKMKFP